MSSSESLTAPTQRKLTASERVTHNGDPLVVRKKAREAAKKKLRFIYFYIKLTFHSNQPSSTLTKIILHLKPFLKRHLELLKVLMEVMTMKMTNR